MLQCRAGKRTGKGAVKIAVDMVNEGLVDKPSAIKMVEPQHLDQLLHPQVHSPMPSSRKSKHKQEMKWLNLRELKSQFEDPSAYKDRVVATGLPASPGAAVGQVVFGAEDAEEWHAQGKSVILV